MCFILIGISFYVSNGFEYIYQISNSIYFVLQFLRAEMLQLIALWSIWSDSAYYNKLRVVLGKL